MSAETIGILRSGESGEMVDALSALCAADYPVVIDDEELVLRLVRSADPLVRERAIFLFGIRLKRADMCGEFLRQLAGERLADAPVISALILAIVSSGCRIDPAPLKASLARLLDDPDIRQEIGVLLVGFARVATGDLAAGAFKPYLVRSDGATPEELEQARRLLV